MASQAGKWETVGGGKRSKATNHESDKKKGEQPMATMDVKDPLAPSQTLFNGFHQKSQQGQKAKKDDASNISPHQGKKAAKPVKKPSKPDPIHPRDIVNKMSGSDLKDFIATNSAKYDDESICLKLLAEYLQDQFANCDPLDSDPSLKQQEEGFPFHSAPKDVQQALRGSMQRLGTSGRQDYFVMCVNQLLQQAKSGSQVFGWRLLVQAICVVQPAVPAACVDTLSPLVRPCANHPRHCLPLMWCFEQIPVYGPKMGNFSIWQQAYLRVLLERNNIASKVQSHALDRLNILIMAAEKKPQDSSPVPHQLVMDLLQLAIGQSSDPPPFVLEEVQKQYTTVLRIFLSDPDPTEIVRLFECLLPLLRPHLIQVNRSFMEAVFSLLVTCLHMNTSCFRSWLQIHRKNIQQSSYFLKRLNAGYTEGLQVLSDMPLDLDSMIDFLPRLDTIPSSGHGSVSQQMRQESSRNSKALLKTVSTLQAELAAQSASQGRWWIISVLFWSLATVLLAVVAADVYESRSWTASTTRLYLEQWGVLDVCKRISSEVWNAGVEALRWLDRTALPVLARWSRDAEPYFMQAVEFYEEAIAQLGQLVIQAAVWIENQYATLVDQGQ
eukprot:scpid48724/ scgid25441/ 